MADKNKQKEKRFRMMVCIDGSDECYRGLRYAAKLGSGTESDITLLYVRPVDKGLRSGGLQVSVARENIMAWGLDLPGVKYLKKGRDLLTELGFMGEDWNERLHQEGAHGDPLGNHTLEYMNEDGKKISLKLKVSPDIASAILEDWEEAKYDLIILGASERWRKKRSIAAFFDPAVAEKVAVHAPCSVIVARELEVGNGHLICIDGSDHALNMVRRDAALASRCQCPISIISVALDQADQDKAQANVDRAKAMLDEMGIEVKETMTRVGNPVEEITEVGPDYSLVVVSDSEKSAVQRFFMGSNAFQLMQKSFNSVMIVR